MALYRTGGGGGGEDYALPSPTVAPDIVNCFQLARSATKTITTTQKAKRIVAIGINYVTSSVGGALISYDVDTDTQTEIMGHYTDGDFWYDSISAYTINHWISDVTSTSFKIKNSSSTVARNYIVMVWY